MFSVGISYVSVSVYVSFAVVGLSWCVALVFMGVEIGVRCSFSYVPVLIMSRVSSSSKSVIRVVFVSEFSLN